MLNAGSTDAQRKTYQLSLHPAYYPTPDEQWFALLTWAFQLEAGSGYPAFLPEPLPAQLRNRPTPLQRMAFAMLGTSPKPKIVTFALLSGSP